MNLDRSGDRVAEAMRLRIIVALGVAAGWPTLCVLEWVAPLGCNIHGADVRQGRVHLAQLRHRLPTGSAEVHS